jgi:ATP-dependent RNA helicase RhlE
LLRREAEGRSLVFVNAQRDAEKLGHRLIAADIPAAVLHGGHSQHERFTALDRFREGAVKVLVATDLAARGLDIPGVTLVVNLELPSEPKQYVHRIGRTGRAGAAGTAIAICDETERKRFQSIQELMRQDLEPLTDHPWHSAAFMDDVMHRPGHWRAPSLHPDRKRERKLRIPPTRLRKR